LNINCILLHFKLTNKMSQIINCKVQHIRPQYQHLQEWMFDPNNVYIGRKGVVFIDGKRFPPESSPFANPYKIGKDGTREEVLTKYKEYICLKLETNDGLKKELLSMRGKKWGCWCHPDKCHGDVLLEILNGL